MTSDTAPIAPLTGAGSRLLRTRVRKRYWTHDLGYWLVLAGVLANCFAGHWGDMGIPGPADRILLGVGFGLEYLRARRAGVLPRPTTTAFLLAAASVWAVISWFASPIRTQTGLFGLVDLYVVPMILFSAAPVLFGTRHRRFAFAAAFSVFGIYLGTNAIAQTLQLNAFVFPGYILDPSIGIHIDRARGPYTEAVNMGMMLIFSGVLGGYLVRTASSRRWRIIGALAIGLCTVGVALTLTRAIWLAAALIVALTIAVLPELRRRLPLVLGGLAVAALLFLIAFPDYLTVATDRGEAQSPIWDRQNVNQAAAAMAVQNPLTGVGWNQAQYRMSEYIRLGKDYPVTAVSGSLIPHNVFLGHFAELGILGASLWLASVVAAVVVPIAQRHRPGFGAWRFVLLCFALCWIVVANFGPVNYSQPQYLLFLVGGIAAMGREVVPVPWDWRQSNRIRSTAVFHD